ncbi:MAG TPA: hypothetical protein VFU69_04430 [Ktedonobacterales bacterium]|nr:hypothetical protein [Ktedonobacterales bacterium]
MNTRDTRSHPKPTSICASFAAILPVLDEPVINTREAAEARAHLATCAYCQAQRDDYYRLDTAMRRSLSPSGTPHPRTEDIMSKLIDDTGGDQPTTEAAPPPSLAPRERATGRARLFLSGLGTFATVLVVAILIAMLLFRQAAPSEATIIGVPTPTAGSLVILRDISMVSPTEGWAVGYTQQRNDSDGTQSRALLMHYKSGTWFRVSVAGDGELDSISMLSAKDGWAVGYRHSNRQPIILHYNGQSWKSVATSLQNRLAFIQMLSDTDGWAIGTPISSSPNTDSILHYNGQSWTPQPLPASLDTLAYPLLLSDLFMASPAEGWIVGYTLPPVEGNQENPTEQPTSYILHYTGGQWTVAETFPGTRLTSLSMTSVSDGWAVGTNVTAAQESNPAPTTVLTPTSLLLLHYTGGTWVPIASPEGTASNPYATFKDITGIEGVQHVSMTSATDGWILTGANANSDYPALLHYDGNQWNAVRMPAFQDTSAYVIAGISMLSPTEGWAVGWSKSQDGSTVTYAALILHNHNGIWSVAQS